MSEKTKTIQLNYNELGYQNSSIIFRTIRILLQKFSPKKYPDKYLLPGNFYFYLNNQYKLYLSLFRDQRELHSPLQAAISTLRSNLLVFFKDKKLKKKDKQVFLVNLNYQLLNDALETQTDVT